MGKKVKVPIALRFVRWLFPILEKYFPDLAKRLFVQLFFTPLHYGFPKSELQWVESAELSTANVAGKKVQLYSWGDEDKPIVLFVHGWAGRGTQFKNFFSPILNNGYRIISFDGPAHGKSGGKRTTILEFVELLGIVINRYGKPETIIAHSFGGVVSLMGKVNGNSFDKLINIGSPTIGDEIIRTFLREVNGTWATAEAFKKHMIKKYSRSFDEFSGEHFLKQVKGLKLLIVHDENDKDVPISHVHRALEIYPRAETIITKGLGHTRILKEESVIEACIAFIRKDG